MNPLSVIAGVIATTLVFLTGAYTNNQSISYAAIKPSTIRLISVEMNVESNGSSVNDHKSITKRILSPEGRIIGNGYQACIMVKERVEYCSGVYNLPLGKITFSGSRQNRSRYTFVVTGGTGSYLAAGGRLESSVFGFNPFREKINIHIE